MTVTLSATKIAIPLRRLILHLAALERPGLAAGYRQRPFGFKGELVITMTL